MGRRRCIAWILAFLVAFAVPAAAEPMTVTAAQETLTSLGYDTGPVDGRLGPQSENALRLFQAARNLPVTGQLDTATMAALGVPATASIVEEPTPDAANDPEKPSWIAIALVLSLLVVALRWSFLFVRWILRGIAGLFRGSQRPEGQDYHVRQEPAIARADTAVPESVTPSAPQPTPPKSRKKMRASPWVPADESATVAGRKIGGMVYVGTAPKDGSYGEPDNAFIDPSKAVARQGGDWDGQELSYWPNYTHLSRRARATYLDWLSEGRMRVVNPGYMFLYFYGLERRYFRDEPDEHERRSIVTEVERLRGVFSDNRSASRYLGAFLDAAALAHKGSTAPDTGARGGVPLSLKVGLARRVEANEPLDAPWLRAWFLSDFETRLRTPARRCEAEFNALFDAIFARQHPNGLPLRRPKRKLEATYHAASGRFEADLSPIIGNLRDVTSLRKPLTIAAIIAEEATDGLEKYSRLLGKDADARGTLAAHALLPAEIRNAFPCAEADALADWARAYAAQGGEVDALDLLQRLTGERPEKLTRKRLTDASDTLLGLGVGMAPDPRFALRAPKAGEPVILFDLPPGTDGLDVSERFRSAALRIGIATMIAQADKTVDEAETKAIDAIVTATPGLTDPERLRLSATARWMRAVPPDMALLRRRMKDATEPAREALAALALEMAAADGAASTEEVAQLEKLYKALGLDTAGLYGALHAALSNASDEPVTVRDAWTAPDGPAIPPERTPAGVGIGLDMTKVESIGEDTREVSILLGSIFSGDETEEEPEEDTPSDPATLPGLTAPQTAFARELATRDHWPEDDFNAAATRHGLMPAGAVEAINEWSFGAYDRAYLDEYDGYDIDPEIAAEIGD